MKNTLITTVALASLTVVSYAQVATHTNASFGVWTNSGSIWSADVNLGGGIGKVGTATINLFNLQNVTVDVLGNSVGSTRITAIDDSETRPQTAARIGFSVVADAGYEVLGVSAFSNGNLVHADPDLINLASNGAITYNEGVNDVFNVADGTILANGSGIQSNDTLGRDPSGNGVASSFHVNNWALNSDGSVLFITHLTDSNIPVIGSEGLVFDAQVVAVPEPSSTALLGLGALGLIARRKR